MMGQRFTDKSLSGACARRKTCAHRDELPVLTPEHAFTLCPRPHALRRAAFEALRSSPLLAETDAIFCAHPAALCEVWLPFNKVWPNGRLAATLNATLAPLRASHSHIISRPSRPCRTRPAPNVRSSRPRSRFCSS